MPFLMSGVPFRHSAIVSSTISVQTNSPCAEVHPFWPIMLWAFLFRYPASFVFVVGPPLDDREDTAAKFFFAPAFLLCFRHQEHGESLHVVIGIGSQNTFGGFRLS